MGQTPAAARPLFADVVVATVVVVAAVVVVATAVVVTGTVATVVAVKAFHLSFLPTLVQMRGLPEEPPNLPAVGQEPPALVADAVCKGNAIRQIASVATDEIVFMNFDILLL